MLGRGAYSTLAGPEKVNLRFTVPAALPVAKLKVPVVPARAMLTVLVAAEVADKPVPVAVTVTVSAPRVVGADRVKVLVTVALVATVAVADKLVDAVPWATIVTL
jgi:hypothetical protein